MGILRALCGEHCDICGKAKTILRKREFFGVRNTLCNQHEAGLTLGSVDVFSADQVAVHRPAVEFAVPESVAANFSVRPRRLKLARRQTPISRDHR